MKLAPRNAVLAGCCCCLALLCGSVRAEEESAPERRLGRVQGAARVDRRTDVVGAVVQLQPEGDPSRQFLTSTDAKGQFWVDGLADGSYRVALRRHGFHPVVKEGVELHFPFRAVVEVTLEPNEGSGAITTGDSDGSSSWGNGNAPISVHGRLVERGAASQRSLGRAVAFRRQFQPEHDVRLGHERRGLLRVEPGGLERTDSSLSGGSHSEYCLVKCSSCLYLCNLIALEFIHGDEIFSYKQFGIFVSRDSPFVI